ncbi:FAD-dependent oxidoreductase [Agrobacterium tumefaciens]|uniref:NAD(P)/FAD-dependent oxidoreductase n=1 Tax=Agrobacterium tumefaciens TaxID=358 RepID=UPI0015730082|nr:FAD-binding oxidoreductase [Agrobacterium tumefaciens]NSZ02069.1 FAD-dependent oxidoreductase [Agrobacterium tumefaciens]NTB05696.1 FAD-dependent oxidoreductase [Agrobacterium tumefaciens]NTB21795.1 FAD-dependent oxidoreductase [Agrobacterium tumefaciens]NTB34521.1 FAD-dependent oxidoreductase [Agrobacterium tumefaciens]NTB42493.1 FAD-dependent oxidoreductase [Agrobacterium tumefaciens]
MKFRFAKPLKRSYWQESIEPSELGSPLAGAQRADIAIVGGGFVGLWTAITIKRHEPDCRVVILEQDICGGGASGRNGGFVMSWWPKIGTLTSFCSREEALFLGRSSEQAISELGEFCRQHVIDAHFVQKGWLWTATTPAHVDSWNGTLDACERLGVRPFERLSSAEVKRRTGSSVHLSGVFEASNATVQPAALVQGMRRVARELGVIIHERSGVDRIQPGTPTLLHCKTGTLSADRVVLATNAWSAALPELARLIMPVNSAIVVTQPLGRGLEQMGWTGGESITDSQLMVDYYRTTRDGRIAFGKGTGAIAYGSEINGVFSDDADSIEMARADLFRTYPGLDKHSITHSWSGPIDRTYDSLPIFGHLRGHPNIFYGVGWSGNGVGPSRMGGRILASLALARDDEWSRSSLVGRNCKTFPSEPLRYFGGNLVRNAVARKENAEMQGRHPGALDKMLARLAPSGLEDKL